MGSGHEMTLTPSTLSLKGGKKKSIVRFALDCAARPFLVFFFFFSFFLLLLLLPVIGNVLSRGDKANQWE